MQNFSLRCFGVGDGAPCPDRNHSSYLYQFGKTSFLIDCGEPISSTFKASGLDYDVLDHIFLSHLHCDHIGGFFMLIQGFWLEQRQRDLRVHLPSDGIEPIRNLLDASCIFDELLAFRLMFEPLNAGEPVAVKTVRVTPFRSSHLDALKKSFQARHPQKFEAFSFLLETDNLRVVHSADIGAVSDLDPLLAKPVDLLVCELAHFKPRELFQYLQGRPVKRIVFIHVGRRYWEKLEETRLLAAKLLPEVNFTFAHDGQLITL